MEMIPLNSKAIVKAKDYEAFLRAHKPGMSEEALQKAVADMRGKERYKEKAVFRRNQNGIIAVVGGVTEGDKKDTRVWPQTIKKSDEPEIDFDKPRKETVKKFLEAVIQRRKAKKEAKLRNMSEAERAYDTKYTQLKKQPRVKYTELTELATIAASAPLPPITRENAIDPFFKNLKVGDTVTTSRYAETQESAAAYTGASWKVTKISSGHKTFEFYGGEYTKKEATGTIQIDDRGSYMSIKVKGSSGVLRAYMTDQQLIPPFESAIAHQVALQYWSQSGEESLAKKAAKKAEDWTKSKKSELVRIIDEFFEKQGKSMKGYKTADKPRLLEIIRQYKIRE